MEVERVTMYRMEILLTFDQSSINEHCSCFGSFRYIVSDCDSLNEMFNAQHYTKTPEETAALAVNSGLDLNCGSFLSKYAQTAVDRGLLNETTISKAVSNNFATMMRLGFFDGNPINQLYGKLGPKDVCTAANQELAREVARQGIVLLKNTKGSLPLSPASIKSLAVIGPNAAATHTMLGNYEGIMNYHLFLCNTFSYIFATAFRDPLQVYEPVARPERVRCHGVPTGLCRHQV